VLDGRWNVSEWKRICCAIDFSEMSRFAMEEAADLAGRSRARLTLLHVFEPPPPLPMDVLIPVARTGDTASVDLERRMAAWRSEAAERNGGPVHSAVRIGNAAAEILRFAREEATDLVVLGTHGRTGFEHLVLGSVAERVVRQAPCPVLVIRTKEPSEAASIADEAAQYA
jgi:nucleotide-binding universal stress UspA family protein